MKCMETSKENLYNDDRALGLSQKFESNLGGISFVLCV